MSKEKDEKRINKNKEKKSKEEKAPKKPAVPTEYRFSHTVEEPDKRQPVTKDVISKKTKTVVIIMLVCLISVVIATGWNYLAPDKLLNNIQKNLSGQVGDDYPTFISGTKISDANFKYGNNHLNYVSDTSLICLNKSAGKVVDRPISFSQPALKISGQNILTYNIDGTGYQIDTIGNTLVKNEVENSIIQGDITDSGTYGFITKTDGYLSALVVFNSKNEQIYKYSFADYYATSFSIDKSGTKAAVTTVSTKDGDFKTVIYILDFSKDEPISMIEESDFLAYDCTFMDNESVAVVGNNRALMVKSNFSDVEKYDYEGLTLTAYQFDRTQGGVISLSPSSDGGNCHIVYLSKNGELNKIKDTEYRVSDIDIYGGKIAILCDGGFTAFITTNGEDAGTIDSGIDAQSISMYSENSIYILGVSEIREAGLN